MNLIVDRLKFLTAVSIAHKAVAKRSTIPILACGLLESKDQVLSITATDNEIAVTTRLQLDQPGNGSCAVHMDRLKSVLSALDGEMVGLKHEGGSLHVVAGKTKVRLPAMDGADFPLAPRLEGPEHLVPCGAIGDVLGHVAYAMGEASDKERPMLCGASLFARDGLLCGVASDGQRLAYREVSAESPVDVPKVFVPRRAMELWRHLSSTDGEASITVGVNQVRLEVGWVCNQRGTTVACALPAMPFPEEALWRPLLPVHDSTLTVETEALRRAVTRVGLFADEWSSIIMELGSPLKLSAESMDKGGADDTVDPIATSQAIVPLRAGMRADYLIDALELADETVSLGWTDMKSPLVIRSAGQAHAIMWRYLPGMKESK